MTEVPPPLGSPQELTSALAMLADSTALGTPRCPPGTAAAIARAVIDRSKRLGQDVRQAVRLVRLAALCAPRGAGYAYLLYAAVPALTPNAFRAAIRSMLADGRVPPGRVRVEADGVVMLEPGVAVEAGRSDFALAYRQMPRLAGLLDVLHNTLGYDTVARLVQPAIASDGPVGLDAAARDLRNAFNGWLAGALTSREADQKRRVILDFLDRRSLPAGRIAARIDNDLIRDFWIARASYWRAQIDGAGADRQRQEELARDEGLRVFRSAVIAMLRYRRALEDALAERALADVEPLDEVAEADATALAVQSGEPWVSPVAVLSVPPASRVKWLVAKRMQRLRNFLGAAPNKAETGESDLLEAKVGGALNGPMPFDPALALTLLRVDVFDTVQQAIIQRMRRRMEAGSALDEALAGFAETSYAATIGDYTGIREDIEAACWAALDVLGKAGRANAALLVGELGGREVLRELVTMIGPLPETGDGDAAVEILPAVGAAIAGVFARGRTGNAAIDTLVEQAQRGHRAVNREGFRRQDELDPGSISAIEASLPAAIAMLRALQRLCAALAKGAPNARFDDDKRAFLDGMRLIYASPVEQAR